MRLSVRITVEGSKMVVDLSDLPAQVEAPINAGAFGGAVSAIRVAFKSLIAPMRPADEALFDPLEVVIPDGTVLSATNNAPMGLWNQLPPTLGDLFLRAIGERLPERVTAGHHGYLAAALLSGTDDDGRWWFVANNAGGGFGASANSDGYGPLPTIMLGDNPQVPLELTEGRYPIRNLNYRLMSSQGGRGLHRGGPGIERTFEVLKPSLLNTHMNRTRDPAWGMAGGEPGRPGSIHIKLPNNVRWSPAGHLTDHAIPAGTIVRIRTGGGGGWGPPRAQGRLRRTDGAVPARTGT